ncbi:insulin-like growth factor 3 [Chanos chanos]|uniref:Insulin-like growth factor 3 n=1 Tax=Chanos chanos TaxID=29144 RepID=A0A6J2WB22_CHACN|nr:insulin-like growth factor [Chanos chanos]
MALPLLSAYKREQFPCWRNVCVVYSMLWLVVLPNCGETGKTRCGQELVAALEFVCGDRGFYRGKVGGPRGGPRSRAKGIVEQCCTRSCDLQHLETYCAKPKRNPRQVPVTPQQTAEEQFRKVFQRRYLKLSMMAHENKRQNQKVSIHFRGNLKSIPSRATYTKLPKSALPEFQNPHTERTQLSQTFTPSG